MTGGRQLRFLNIDAVHVEILKKHGLITCKDVLLKTEIELMSILNVSIFAVRNLLEIVSKVCCPTPVTALTLLDQRKHTNHLSFIPTSLGELDAVLRGGLMTGSVTEVAGPAGCGKTQFCLMQCITASLVNFSGSLCSSVIYIDTETTFCPQRLVEIAVNRFPDVFDSEQSQIDLLSKVHVFTELTCNGLLTRLQNLEEDIIRKNVKLVVLDSIASLVRKEFDSTICYNMAERSNLLAKIAATLKQMAESLSITVITTNQITTHISQSKIFPEDATDTGIGYDVVVPSEISVSIALGNTWSHCVNTRLIVQYVDGIKRQIYVAKSPVAPFVSFIYSINASGLVLHSDASCSHYFTSAYEQHIRVRSAVGMSEQFTV